MSPGLYLVRSLDCGECWVDKDDSEVECNTTQVWVYSNSTGETELQDNPMDCVRSVFAWIG